MCAVKKNDGYSLWTDISMEGWRTVAHERGTKKKMAEMSKIANNRQQLPRTEMITVPND